jgi:hypothetical protein
MHYFLVYNDNTHNHYLNKLLESVNQFGPEFEIILFNKEDMDKNFTDRNSNILTLSRGGGYWLWKPYIIHKTLINLKEEDILLYVDSKYFFMEPFMEWIESLLKSQDCCVFRNKPNEPTNMIKHWCKMDVIHKYNGLKLVFEENKLDAWAGFILLRKTPFTISFIQEWLEMCTYENITDIPSIIPNDVHFIDHRHDQSLLSILLHKYNIEMPFFDKRYLQNVRCPY